MQRTESKLQLLPCLSLFPSCNSDTAWANHSLKVAYSHSLGSDNLSSAVLLHWTGFCLIALFNTIISLFNLETVTKDIASSVSTTDWIPMLWPTFCLVYCTTLPPLQPFLLTLWSHSWCLLVLKNSHSQTSVRNFFCGQYFGPNFYYSNLSSFPSQYYF